MCERSSKDSVAVECGTHLSVLRVQVDVEKDLNTIALPTATSATERRAAGMTKDKETALSESQTIQYTG